LGGFPDFRFDHRGYVEREAKETLKLMKEQKSSIDAQAVANGLENCNITPGDTVAVWGCGPVGQFAIKSVYLLGAERVIAIDRFPERLKMAKEKAGAHRRVFPNPVKYAGLMAWGFASGRLRGLGQ
jgi:threonine dehydrogenase-like Zn-dependent dehydrogenase